MRICILNEFFFPDATGGTGTVLSSLARSLCDQHPDMEIDVLTSRHLYRGAAGRLPAREDWRGIGIARLATPCPNRLPTLLRLAANAVFALAALMVLLRRRPYDLLLIGTAPPILAAVVSAVKRLKGTPFVYVVYDLEPDRAVAMKVVSARNPLARLLCCFQRGWLHGAAKVVVLGRCMARHLESAYALSPGDIEVIPIGADPQEIVASSRECSRFRAQNGLEGVFVALYAGNFGRYHDFDTILDAAKQVQGRRENIVFVLVGGGAQKAHVARRVAAEDIRNVRLFDFVAADDYADLLACADVSLVTLEPGMEGLCVPSKFYSILASGRPTIAMVAPRCEVALVLAEARCGLQVAQGDAAGLVEALSFLARCPGEAQAMGLRARDVLLERFAALHVAARYRAVLQAVCAPAVFHLASPLSAPSNDAVSDDAVSVLPPEANVCSN